MFAIMVCLVSVSTVAAIISLRFNRRQLAGISLDGMKARQVMDDASTLAMELDLAFGQGQLAVYPSGADTVQYQHYPWGLYSVLGLEHIQKGDTLRRCWLNASDFSATGAEFNLLLAEHNRPLVLCGDARLKGVAKVPKSGLKQSFLEGRPYTGTSLIEGSAYPEAAYLPSLDTGFVRHLAWTSKHGLALNQIPRQLRASYQDSTLIIKGERLSLEGLDLSGRVLVLADSAIMVAANTKLDGVILMAPEIYFADGFVGSLQAFATYSIQVGQGVRLVYPSVLSCRNQLKAGKPGGIKLASQARLEGSLLLHGDYPFRQASSIEIAPGATVEGFLYCDGYLQHRGQIEGICWIDQLRLYTGSGIYDNYLLDGRFFPLPKGLGACLPASCLPIANVKRKTLLQWLD
jgi:hypothetical protein